MSAAKNTVRIQRMCVAALLCAIAILIPMISPVKIQLGPMSFTLGSHVAIFIAMFISPAVALTVELGATLGFLLAGFPPVVVLRALSQVVFVAIGAFLLAKKPAVMKNGLSIFLFGLVMGVIHGVLEAVVVTAFWFSGMTMAATIYRRMPVPLKAKAAQIRRTIVGSMPKYSATPAQTPQSIRLLLLYSFFIRSSSISLIH